MKIKRDVSCVGIVKKINSRLLWINVGKIIQRTVYIVENKKIKSIVESLEYYLMVNEENGVVFVPKFFVEDAIKQLKEVIA